MFVWFSRNVDKYFLEVLNKFSAYYQVLVLLRVIIVIPLLCVGFINCNWSVIPCVEYMDIYFRNFFKFLHIDTVSFDLISYDLISFDSSSSFDLGIRNSSYFYECHYISLSDIMAYDFDIQFKKFINFRDCLCRQYMNYSKRYFSVVLDPNEMESLYERCCNTKSIFSIDQLRFRTVRVINAIGGSIMIKLLYNPHYMDPQFHYIFVAPEPFLSFFIGMSALSYIIYGNTIHYWGMVFVLNLVLWNVV